MRKERGNKENEIFYCYRAVKLINAEEWVNFKFKNNDKNVRKN